MKVKIALLSIFAACASACSTTQPQAPSLASERVYAAPKVIAWKAALAELGLEFSIKSSDESSGLVTTDFISLPVGNWNINKAIQRWVLAPRQNVLVGYSALRVSANLLVTQPGPNKTLVGVHLRYEALQGPLGAPGDSWVGAQSNGSLEQEILTRIQARISALRVVSASGV